jgi:hypothetical protein
MICVWLMRFIGAIPVYPRTIKLRGTIHSSLHCLARGESLVIFPEKPGEPLNPVLSRFGSGFIVLVRMFYRKYGSSLTIYPVAAHRKSRIVRIGEAVRFQPKSPFPEERVRIQEAVQSLITEMYQDMEREAVRSKGAG